MLIHYDYLFGHKIYADYTTYTHTINNNVWKIKTSCLVIHSANFHVNYAQTHYDLVIKLL